MGRAADRLGRVESKFRTLPDEAVHKSNRTLKASVDRVLRQDAGSDRRLSGVHNGVPQTINVTKRSLGHLVVGHVMAGPRQQRAPWFWMQEGVEGHPARIVRRDAGPRREVGWHPGTPAKKTWTRGIEEGLPDARAEFERLFRQAVEG